MAQVPHSLPPPPRFNEGSQLTIKQNSLPENAVVTTSLGGWTISWRGGQPVAISQEGCMDLHAQGRGMGCPLDSCWAVSPWEHLLVPSVQVAALWSHSAHAFPLNHTHTLPANPSQHFEARPPSPKHFCPPFLRFRFPTTQGYLQ